MAIKVGGRLEWFRNAVVVLLVVLESFATGEINLMFVNKVSQ